MTGSFHTFDTPSISYSLYAIFAFPVLTLHVTRSIKNKMRLKDVRSHPDKRDFVALAESTDYNVAEA
ncbi:hypothetical protein J3Q64DRAFT_1827394 [Phycomyces blakesleeanus]|uniref:Uncharacterized protein n=2 Tax=Phycomyces blakesleeanus TaxID=4837 RepID=A0A162URA1_PHYB8|nr:hypothetical protein PHYBLDRAFT_141459 [Phycomyces blakesleeanus NRRL 1555(-)]XP_018295682.1 hypothetical protein PHYBLDRAFT_141512 [Phycomyces blakesleeanus NRRL 1555(-)]OAD77582.1 hypothetical protein PHYBLDRAFT_141459 [Phycomyces blakesleeanus NRRL 1555(-)]OAD77642.1 hypothetical protein PHYBLDRAFT_141512 [Phycomyces blakesleeanus NRRL 1555(-)]|eukprot:XP_018295622.1 hypothetical protein PHYBLDRAFT_141459 [Phycomyces blakesleeanus NRRL 1555(-)]